MKPKIRWPTPLKKNDSISIVAPSFNFNKAHFDQGVKTLESNFNIHLEFDFAHLQKKDYYLGSDEDRTNELFKALVSKSTNAVLSARGGFGMAHLLPALLKKLKKQKSLTPKIVAGYSDMTPLLNLLFQDLGWITFHTPMVAGRAIREPSAIEKQTFKTCLFTNKALGKITHPQMEVLNPGEASGRLVGGCLTLVASSIGTAYEIKTKDRILFLEDTDERPYRIERMLLQLKHAGALDQVRGLVFGEIYNCNAPTDPNHPTYGVNVKQAVFNAIGDFVKKKKIPVLYGFPSGHGENQYAFPIGGMVNLNARAKTKYLEFIRS